MIARIEPVSDHNPAERRRTQAGLVHFLPGVRWSLKGGGDTVYAHVQFIVALSDNLVITI
ncbi:MAG: hypothetical protein ACI9SB_001454 [Candidatus Azotimanducaceae bacterium]|jgi:hypothetical protein